MKAYSDSKLANLYFAYELARKMADVGDTPLVTAVRPGWTSTNLQRHSGMAAFLNNFFAQRISMGAQPTLRAATDENVAPGDYFGGSNFFKMRGPARQVTSNDKSHDREIAPWLWALSEEMAGVSC